MMDGKGLRRERCGRIQTLLRVLPVVTEENKKKLKSVNLPPEIRTRHFPNTSQEGYPHVKPLGILLTLPNLKVKAGR
jgi:hypothetical protein